MLTGERLVRDGLAHPSEEVRLATVAVAVDEGLERYARILAMHVATSDDERVEAAVRDAVRSHRWPDPDDEWARALIRWAGGVEPRPTEPEIEGPENRSRWAAARGHLLDGALLVGVTLVLGSRPGAFRGFPKGNDAYGHVSKIALIHRALPHIAWNPYWYAGLPHFQGSYPPLLHVTGALVVTVTRWSPARALTAIALTSVLVAAGSLYATVLVLGRRRAPAVIAGLVFLACPGLWAGILQEGTYARLLALAAVGVAVFAAALHITRRTRRTLVFAAVSLAIAFLTHMLGTVVAVPAVGAMLAAAPARGWRQRLSFAASVGLSAAGLAGFFYVPFALLPRPKTTPPTGVHAPSVWTLFVPKGAVANALPFGALPLVLLAAGIVYAATRDARSRRRGIIRQRLRRPAFVGGGVAAPELPADVVPLPSALGPAVGLALVGLAGVVWAQAGHLGLHLFVYGVDPSDFYVFSAWLLAAGTGVVVAVVGRPSWLPAEPVVPAAALAAISLVVCRALLPAPVLQTRDPLRRAMQTIFPAEARHQQSFRFGASTDQGGDWVGAAGDTPIVRGYQNQGTVNVDWQFWAERALWDGTLPRHDRAYAFDWYAVKWIATDIPAYGAPAALDASPDVYDRIATAPTDDNVRVYRNRNATPIAAPSVAPTALVIGSSAGYGMVFRALASAGLDSASIVPVDGGSRVDRYSLADLRRFDTVVLYGAEADSWKVAGQLLSRYVRGGGRLVIEAADWRPADVRRAPPVFPVRSFLLQSVTGAWGFGAVSGTRPNSLLNGVRPVLFSPPAYNGSSPWQVAVPRSVRAWATTVLSSGGRPLLVAGQYGKGTVAWSGLNLPFHAAAFDNPTEARLLGNLLGADRRDRLASSGHAVNPERSVVPVPAGSHGVLFKETAAPGWRATIGGNRATVYRAGPGFMYVPVTARRSRQVTFTYHQTPVELAGWALTGVTAVALLAYAAGARLPRRLKTRAATAWETHVLGTPR